MEIQQAVKLKGLPEVPRDSCKRTYAGAGLGNSRRVIQANVIDGTKSPRYMIRAMLRKPFQLILSKKLYDRLFGKRLSKERAILIFKAGIASIFGRKIVCHLCGRPLTKAVSFVYNGRVHVWGIHIVSARVDFEDRLTLRFSHAVPGECSAQSVKRG